MIGKTISKYSILKELGQGGMGEVFLAQDMNLGRHVALKFLSAEMQRDPGVRKRFLREGKVAAAIDHPYICKIYEVKEFKGKAFIVMEYLEGQTVREKLTKGPLPLKEALRAGFEVAEALEEIHSHRFVHRDLKPSNIMMTKQGHVKLMDFGLAKEVLTPKDLGNETETPTDLTLHGSIVGTVAYMSPEQARQQEVDGRSDIFSFGIVLYEMITGVHPFQKKTQLETAGSILKDIPLPLTRYTNAIPELLQHTLSKMLAKEPDQRYQSVHELRTNLGQLLEGSEQLRAAKSTRPAIAVLPFADMSPQKDQGYFCDGLAEELMTGLRKLKELLVTARTSAFRFRDAELDVREIGRQLNVGTILEGSVRKAGDRLRIGVQLINVEDGYRLWSELYERKLADVFEIQDEISRAVVKSLKITFLGMEGRPLFRPSPKNVKVYELYLRGRYCWNKRTEEGLRRSVKHFQRAIDRDPDYALAHSGLAASYATLSIYGAEPPKELMPKAKSSAEKALHIDSELALALVSLGCVRSMYEWDWQAADQDFRRAIEIEPENEHAHHWYATSCLMPLGRFDEARSEIKRAQEIDPLNLIINATAGLQLYFERRYDKAIEEYLKNLELDYNFGMARFFLGQAYAQKAMYGEAIAELQRAEILNQGSPETKAALGHVYAIAGKRAKAQKLIDELEQLSTKRYVSPVLIAQIHTGLEDMDRVFDCLEKAYQNCDTYLIWLKTRPVFDSIRSDPRFGKLCKRIGFPES